MRKMAKTRPLIWTILIIGFILIHLLEANSDIETDGGLPGISFEFKVHVDAGKEHCFYQYVEPSANLFVAFQVR